VGFISVFFLWTRWLNGSKVVCVALKTKMSFYVSLPKNNITAYAIPVSTTNNSPSKCSEPKMHCFTKCQPLHCGALTINCPLTIWKWSLNTLRCDTVRHSKIPNPKYVRKVAFYVYLCIVAKVREAIHRGFVHVCQALRIIRTVDAKI